MTANEIQKYIASLDGLSNVEQVHLFSAVRKRKDGGDELVTIEVHDAGPDCEIGRYSVIARNKAGKGTSGNSFDTIEPALACVHWYKLDD